MRRLSHVLNLSAVLFWLSLLLLAGCDGTDRIVLGNETNEPYYRQGDQLKRQGRYQEALTAYLKVIEKRNENAPESHLEAGLIFQQYLKDPIYAIYHFRKYLELEPNSRQAELVRQRIDAAMRDFARTLPARPLEDQMLRLDLMDRIDALQKENASLKDEIAKLSQGGTSPGADSGPMLVPVPEAPASEAVIHGGFANAPAADAAAVQPVQPREQTDSSSAKPASKVRTHVVVNGETLAKIARLYYGNSAKWHAIFEANRDVLKDEKAVRAGMTLKIP
jgi:tetratricopeptide (TPR) repeat protein